MDCENQFCVYQKEGKCLLDEISVNCIGMCEDYRYINMSETLLDKIKAKHLNDMHQGLRGSIIKND